LPKLSLMFSMESFLVTPIKLLERFFKTFLNDSETFLQA
jgi:hypothetical protein